MGTNPLDNAKSIGVFDSGIGGLTVVKQIEKVLPCEEVVYLGDTARVPYGIRSEKTILKYSVANTNFLLRQNIKVLVIACNTASAIAAGILRNKYSIPIVDVIRPGALKAVAVTKTRRIGIIGTEATIKSGAYQNAIIQLLPKAEIFTQACPLFVPLAEEGWCSIDDEVVRMIAQRYLSGIKDAGIDTLVLGCTHYPLLKKVIQLVMGDRVNLVDSALESAHEVKKLLVEENMFRDCSGDAESRFFLTDIPHSFIEHGSVFLGHSLTNVKLVDI